MSLAWPLWCGLSSNFSLKANFFAAQLLSSLRSFLRNNGRKNPLKALDSLIRAFSQPK